jgi:transposase
MNLLHGITDVHRLAIVSMLDWYRNKDQLEKIFDTLKNELDERRMRVHSAENMQGKFFLNFIASVLYSALLHRMKRNDLHKKMSVPELLLLLKKWRVIEFQDGNSFTARNGLSR